MTGRFDFSIEELGPCKVLSPIHLSTERDDYRANYVRNDEFIRYNVDVTPETQNQNINENDNLNLMEKAGPREYIYFNPKHVNAGICTCGGLCPGLNDVIRAVVRCLYNRYGVRRIRGIRFGFKGFFAEQGFDTIDLTPDNVDDIHKTGGSFLGTSRGGGDRVVEIADAIEALNMNMLFIIGGDGTQRGALEVAEEIERRGLKIAVVGIPKTVDNDLIFIQKSFGFDTAVQKAAEAVAAAHMEAHSHINGIGLIKLMGRESGFIATSTALASHEANFCLIPESPFDLEGPNGLLENVKRRLLERGHAVILIAEGAGQEFLPQTGETDASGNLKFHDIGVFLKDEMKKYFAEQGITTTIKYIDPSYIIRSAPADSYDSIYCARIGAHAVHAAMAGKTQCIASRVNNQFVYIPIKVAVSKRSHVDIEGSLWRDVLENTRQPFSMKNND